MSNDISGLVKADEKEKIKFEKKGARFLEVHPNYWTL